MAQKKQPMIVIHDISGLTAKRAADSTTTIHQAIAMLLNAPHLTMHEQDFLMGLSRLPHPATRPHVTLHTMSSNAPRQYGEVVLRKGNMIVFNPAWLVEIQKYQW